MAEKKKKEKKTCTYKLGDYKCDRPLYDEMHCVFHSKDKEGKKDKFMEAFWKEYEAQQKNDKLVFTGFIFPPEADLSRTKLIRADLRDADLREVYLSLADLRSADLTGAGLTGAFLERTDLRGTNLCKTNLTGALFPGANLDGANLDGANLWKADLKGAFLKGANLTGAFFRITDYWKDLLIISTQAMALPKEKLRKLSHLKSTSPDYKNFYITIPVFYGTNRKKTGTREPNKFYSSEYGELVLGKCSVTIPLENKHKMGRIENPSIFRLEFKENPKKHFTILKVEEMPENDFLATINNHIKESSMKEAIIFIHGYNSKFAGAAKRTAQLAHDLGIETPILYSWPSYGEIKEYFRDEESVKLTVSHLKQFLKLIYEKTGITKFHIVAHSMGNRALTNALKEISSVIRKKVDEGEGKIFNEVILAAPDINAELFKQEIAPRIINVPERITLYASNYDRALKLSKKIHDYARVGESGKNLIVMPGIETVDASLIKATFLGHTYFSKNPKVIMDIYHLIKNRLPPKSRNLIQRIKSGIPYWIFKK